MSVSALDPVVRVVHAFRGSRAADAPRARLAALLDASARFRESFLDAPPVAMFRSFDLVRLPYPTRYALRDACPVPAPFVQLVNRLFVIRFDGGDGRPRTLLVSPSDPGANRATPFFRRLAASLGPVQGLLEPRLAPVVRSVSDALSLAGVTPEEVDYLTYDHLHAQDLRPWLGQAGRPGFFPHARLLVMHQEWESVRSLLPPQADWYCPEGVDGIDPDRVLPLESDVRLGESVALVRTPGHTEGNHTIVVRVPSGIVAISENGVCADSWAPSASRIPGLPEHARRCEVVLNGNTLERGLDQYLSMMQERVIAGAAPGNPLFFHVIPSSELVPSWLSPGIRPTYFFGEITTQA